MDRHVYGFNVQALSIIQVHVVPMKCDKCSLKVKFLTKILNYRADIVLSFNNILYRTNSKRKGSLVYAPEAPMLYIYI